MPALDDDLIRRGRDAPRHRLPGRVHLAVGGGIGGRDVDRHAAQLLQAVVLAGVEREYLRVVLEDADERLEQRPVEAVAVEVVGHHIGGRDEDDARGKQRRKQPRQDHGVGDVVDREFVEAQHPCLFGQRAGDRRDRIVLVHLAALQRLAVAIDAIMRVGHEVVEMHAPLAPHRHQLEEHVHQHGLAAPDAALDVEAAHRRMHVAALGEQPAERARLCRDALVADVVDQPVERLRQRRLRGVERNLAARDQMLVALGDRDTGL